MKANDLVVGKKYWCGWASRYARFVKFKMKIRGGTVSAVAVFRDICDCFIECEVENLDRWVREA